MADNILNLLDKLWEFLQKGKVVTTNVIECKQSGNGESVTAIVIVFDNGHTEVRCPVPEEKCVCSYGDQGRPIQPKRSRVTKITGIIVIVIIILIILAFLIHLYINLFSAFGIHLPFKT